MPALFVADDHSVFIRQVEQGDYGKEAAEAASSVSRLLSTPPPILDMNSRHNWQLNTEHRVANKATTVGQKERGFAAFAATIFQRKYTVVAVVF